jgi:hypothetical protein
MLIESQDLNPDQPDEDVTTAEQPQVDEQEAEESSDETGEEQGDAEESGELAVSFDGVEANEPEPENWLKRVREENREKTKRLKQLEREIEALKSGAKVDELGPEPTLEDADIDYDTEKFKARYADWMKRKAQHDQKQEQAKQAEKQAQEAWHAKLSEYGKQKAQLATKAADYEQAEAEVSATLNEAQQSVIVKASANSAMLVYGLGKNEKLLAELAKETDLVQFTWKLAQLEAKMKTGSTPTKPTVPAPEKTVSGGGRPVASNRLDALLQKAEKTGDYTEYMAARNKAKG